MVTIQIEHAVPDFDGWKAAFDRDPMDRRGSGVRSYRIFRPIAEGNHVIIELDLDNRLSADAMVAKLRQFWGSGQADAVLAGPQPFVRLLDSVEHVTL